MDRQIAKEYQDKDVKLRFLKDNCDKLEEVGYMKPYASEDLQAYKDDLANLSININEIEVEKKITSDSYKEQLKPLYEERKELLSSIKQKAVYTKEICYKFTDQDERMTGFYNSEGNLIECRPAMADELQPKMFSLKTGTYNE